MPLQIALFGVATAAGLGFVAGRVTGSRPHVVHPSVPPAEGRPCAEAVFGEALKALEGPAYALVVRVDAVETWRRTHGMAALDRFVARLERSVRSQLPRAVDLRTGDAEVTAVCGGHTTAALRVLEDLKSQTFRLPDGSETLVTCSVGAAAAEEGAALEDLRNRANSAVRAAQEAGRWRAFEADSRGTRPL